MKVAHLPAGFDADATGYVSLLCAALRAQGIDARANRTLDACQDEDGLDVVHIHWLEYIVELDASPRIGTLRSVVRVARFARALLHLKCRHVRVVWTAHNFRPHEPKRPLLETLLTSFVMLVADRVIVHTAYARRRLTRGLPGIRKVVVIPHGNYIGVFPGPTTRRGRPVDKPFTFLCFGQIRTYKQLPEVVRAFRALSNPDVRLVIAGKPVVDAELSAIRAAAGDDPRVVVDARLIPDEEVANLHLRSDAAIVAYREVFSSGALLLAISYGLPVVAPIRSSASELVPPLGLETFEPGGLTSALARMIDGDARARSDAAIRSAQSYPWSRVARATVAVYR